MTSQLIEWSADDLVSLGEELQKKIGKVQEQFQVRAQLAKSTEEVERLRQRLESLVENIQTSYRDKVKLLSKTTGAAEGKHLYNSKLAGIDMETLVYQGDRDALARLLADADFSSTVNRLLADSKPHNARKELLTRGLKLTPRMAPMMYKVTSVCRSALRLRAELEVYVYQDPSFNAACFPPMKDKVLIMVTSSLLEKFAPRELAFVIGHEIGHYLFEHTRFPVGYLLNESDGQLSPLHAMKLFAWIRNAEVTADRAGLVCCRDFDTAANAFFKLSSGLASSTLDFQIEDYMEQLKDLKSEIESADAEPQDWFSTHPFNPLRVKALEIFSRSRTYASLIGEQGGDLSQAEMAAEIEALLSLMEPTYLKDDTDVGKKVQHWVLAGGYLVAAANGVVEASEIGALSAVLGPQVRGDDIATLAVRPVEEIRAEVIALSEEINHLLAPARKLPMLRDMVVISIADGNLDDSELQCLYWLAEKLQIDPVFIDHVFKSARQGVD